MRIYLVSGKKIICKVLTHYDIYVVNKKRIYSLVIHLGDNQN